MSLRDLKQQFLEYLEIERGRSALTVRNYDHYLTRFFDWLGSDKVTDVTAPKLREFRLWLNRLESSQAEEGTLKKRTQNYHLIALRAFLKYLRKQDIKCVDPEVIELAKVPERMIDIISHEEVVRILDAPDTATTIGLRDKCILELLYATGLRVAELCSLSRDDIDLREDGFSIRGKGEKVRIVYLTDTARETLKKYLGGRTDSDEALFIAHGKSSAKRAERNEDLRLTPRTMQRILKHYAIKAGVTKTVTPHTMRHAFATSLLHNGADIRSVQALLGHSSIVTTQIYTHVVDNQLRDIHKKFHSR
ncbi:hypothetical protein A3C89_00275 [Candidatus Kaiserbacteria bacterium RIFCSPHIGHO2_02_FULL_50_50]|uniref:Tyrosine recombinase XerC n=1 Tax=Candidatus Kaiserbacteria bacterium RIFCSPHIGHO2_02_FULL_50_50 TaxID=1798492 RepID=A0A1F6DDY6_9BACT|nr:MAG: hypothetical protein A3C89_00275 [Candidatus Kaiserbacteria bacterium RIFCSPHIGHO2_02_FULL_50_50]